MMDLVSDKFCEYEAELATKAGDSRLAAMWLRAAATIEALQAQIAELEARPPSSPDTDEARAMAAHWEHATPRLKVEGLCDALDASRAECERLRGLLRQCEWAGYHDGHPSPPYQCPCCGNDKGDGHHPSCPVPVAIGNQQ